MSELKNTQKVTFVETIASYSIPFSRPTKYVDSKKKNVGVFQEFKALLVLRHAAACDRRGIGCEAGKHSLHFTN